MSNRVVMAIHAHPDDTEIFSSGTLFLLSSMGFKIVVVTMTDGCLGSYIGCPVETAEIRMKEAAEAADYLNADYETLHQPDGFLFDSLEVRMDLLEIMRKHKPDVIFTHRHDDYHQDHRSTSDIVEACAMISTLPNAATDSKPLEKTPLLYKTDTILSTNRLGDEKLNPHFIIDISSVFEKKIKMFSLHKSQVDLLQKMHGMNDVFDTIKKRDNYWGKKAGYKYSEAFWQHTGGGFSSIPLIQNSLRDYCMEFNDETE